MKTIKKINDSHDLYRRQYNYEIFFLTVKPKIFNSNVVNIYLKNKFTYIEVRSMYYLYLIVET